MTSPNIPVDGRGLDWPRKVANAVNGALARLSGAEVKAQQAIDDAADAQAAADDAKQLAAGFGGIDYSDLDAPTVITLAAGTPVTLTRNLSAADANDKLRGPWVGHTFWDNAANVIRPRALFDVLYISLYLKVTPGATGGTLDVQLLAGTIDIGSKNFSLTAPVGTDQGLRADFMVLVRGGFLANGAQVVVMSDVAADLKEFSPEFYPLSYVP